MKIFYFIFSFFFFSLVVSHIFIKDWLGVLFYLIMSFLYGYCFFTYDKYPKQ